MKPSQSSAGIQDSWIVSIYDAPSPSLAEPTVPVQGEQPVLFLHSSPANKQATAPDPGNLVRTEPGTI